MPWLILILISTLVSGVTSVLQKHHLGDDSHDPIRTGAWYQIIAGTFVALFGILTGQFLITYTTYSLAVTVIISMLWVVGGALYFWLVKRTEASVVALIMTSRVIFTTAISMLFLHEIFSFQQVMGMLLILGGVVLTQQVHRKKIYLKSITLLVLTAFVFGLGNIADRIATKEMNLYLYISASFILPGIFTLAILQVINNRSTHAHALLRHWKPIVLVGTLTAIAATAQVCSISLAPTVGQVVFIAQLKTIVVVLLSALFLKERAHLPTKLFASLLCTIGLVLLK